MLENLHDKSSKVPDLDIFALDKKLLDKFYKKRWTYGHWMPLKLIYDDWTDLMDCKNVWVGKDARLSCLSGMTKKLVTRVQQETLLLVMRKRSLLCGKRNRSTCIAEHVFLHALLHYRVLSVHNPALQLSRPRHICTA